jgi:hypothetical protein
MKADWDKLGAKYADSPNVMIVDVDCTADGKGTCGQQGVKGYPTIKYFMNGKGKAYQQGRDYASLDRFVSSKLNKASCNPITGENCKPNQKKFIDKHKDMTAPELKEIMKKRDTAFREVKAAHRELEKEFRAKERTFKKAQKLHKMAGDMLKAIHKVAPAEKPAAEGEAEAPPAPNADPADAKDEL